MKVGDYVRTKTGIIGKILDIQLAQPIQEKYPNHPSKAYWRDKILISCNKGWRTLQNIDKISPNIIDLIQEGDYVNGCRVEEHAHEKGRLFVTYTYIGGKGFTTHESYDWELTKYNEDLIKSIVTKEQFESMEYEVK